MSLRTIRNNYHALSLRERYLLIRQAFDRQDESEANAIILASPKIPYQLVDFYKFSEAINDLNLVNLLERLKYQEMFDLTFQNLERSDFENSLDKVLTFGYLYTIETDAWKAVGDEFGFDVQIFRQRMAEDFMTFGLLEIKDEMMRKVAFTKEGMTKVCESKKMNSSELKTIETQMAKYREILIKAENQTT